MREILFRGKRCNDGKWVTGDLNQFQDRTIIHSYIDGCRVADDVDYRTVGQYTGLEDKNGVKIFEGDIVKWRFKRVWQEQYHIAEVIWRQSKCGWRLNTAGDTTKMRDDIEYEILGNIYENPEILKQID